MGRVSVALYFFAIFGNSFITANIDPIPIVLSTWNFDKAVAKAWKTLVSTDSALDSIEAGCTTCENLQCDGTVGYGGSPDENGETTLDAMIMDGTTMDVGAVLSLRRIKHVNSVARAVLEHSTHSILAGDLATKFAKQMGFSEETLSTNVSKNMWTNWKQDNCQPNFWKNVEPNPREYCGPYTPIKSDDKDFNNLNIFNSKNHDTIGIIAIDSRGNIASGTSTNGARHKIPGRVGDSPIPGSGSYADSSVGAAAATGDGDVLLRFLPSFLAVEEMRRGSTPSEATAEAVKRISRFYPAFSGAVVAVNKIGEYSAACHGMDTFPYTVRTKAMNREEILWIKCANENDVPEI